MKNNPRYEKERQKRSVERTKKKRSERGPKVQTKRLFAAYELPDDLKETLIELQEELAGSIESVNWAHPKTMHLTTAFMGAVPVDRVEELREILSATAPILISAKNCEARGLGAFPDFRRPSVIWVGAGKGSDALVESNRILVKALRGMKIGKVGDDRPFHPHVTIGRIEKPRPLKDQLIIKRYADELFGHFPAIQLTLFESELTPKGPIHTVIDRYDLF